MSTDDANLTIRGAQLFDGTGIDPRPATVVVQGDRIVDVRGGDAPSRADSTIIDVSGLTLLPGLIDAHTHLGVIDITGRSTHTVAELAAEIFRNLRLCLEAGFTTVRDVGGLDGAVPDLVARGRLTGPTILPSGPLLCQTGGHGDYSDPFACGGGAACHPGLTQFSQVCDGPGEVLRAARQAFRRGATQLKMCLSGGVVSFTDKLEDTQFTVDEIRLAVGEARSRGTYVTAHAHNPASIRLGLDGGVRCFEHGVLLEESTAAAMAQSGAALVPTLTIGELTVDSWREWGIPEEALPRARSIRERMYEAVRVAHHHGVLIGSGSDLLGPDQSRRGLELELKGRVLGAAGALVSATRDNARILGRDDLGTVEAGKLADLIGVAGDPVSAPELLEEPANVSLVMRRGRVVKDIR